MYKYIDIYVCTCIYKYIYELMKRVHGIGRRFYDWSLQHTLQHPATHCNTRQVAIDFQVDELMKKCMELVAESMTDHCNTLQYAATPCNALQHTAGGDWLSGRRAYEKVHGIGHRIHFWSLQHTAIRCNALQRTATHGRWRLTFRSTSLWKSAWNWSQNLWLIISRWWSSRNSFRFCYVERGLM